MEMIVADEYDFPLPDKCLKVCKKRICKMGLNREQIKLKVAEAIENRIAPVETNGRVKYLFYLTPGICPRIYCGWAKMVRPQPHQTVVYTTMKDLDKGFTAEEWDAIADKFLPYFA